MTAETQAETQARTPVPDGAPAPGLLFIVGRGRSGTTLLSRMLRRHTAIEVAPEGFFVMNLRARHARSRFDRAGVDAFCEDLLIENRMRTWQLDVADVRRRLLTAPAPDFATACARVYQSYAETTRGRSGVRWVGDKNPHYALFVRRLMSIFPEARFVHIVRDPRDNVLSYRNVPFDVNDTAALAYRYRRYNSEILDAARTAPGRFHHLRYEDLLATPEPALTGVCGALGLSYDPAMLDFHAERQEGFYGETSHWFDKLGQPLDQSQADKWRAQMSPRDIATIEAVCAPLMARFGYALAAPGDTGDAALSPRTLAGTLLGRATVEAEKLVFGAVPAGLRTWAINTYRSRTGRI